MPSIKLDRAPKIKSKAILSPANLKISLGKACATPVIERAPIIIPTAQSNGTNWLIIAMIPRRISVAFSFVILVSFLKLLTINKNIVT